MEREREIIIPTVISDARRRLFLFSPLFSFIRRSGEGQPYISCSRNRMAKDVEKWKEDATANTTLRGNQRKKISLFVPYNTALSLVISLGASARWATYVVQLLYARCLTKTLLGNSFVTAR